MSDPTDRETPTRCDDQPTERVSPKPATRTSDSSRTAAGHQVAGGTTTFAPGDVLAGRFRVVRFVGQGGMGEVYEARDLDLDERVALKTIRPGHGLEGQGVDRFKREIHLSRQVTHRNVCRIFDLFRHRPEPGRDDTEEVLFLTMEFLEGENLASHLRRTGPLSTRDALPLVEQMVAGLAAAHEAGIVHRDFKTANVMLVPTPDGLQAKITDFGLARSLAPDRDQGLTLTDAGHAVGTPAYMAPEQVTGGSVTYVADIYALGVVLFEMVTGSRPFVGETPLSTAAKRLEEAPPSPRSVVPDLDPRWERAILQCLRRQPEERFQTTTDLVRALAGEKVSERRKASTWWPVRITAAAALAAAVVGGLLVARSRLQHTTSPAGPAEVRTSVAVLAFRNLSERAEHAWLATALAEMVNTELAVGEDLRTVSQDTVARVLTEHGAAVPSDPSGDPTLLRRLLSDYVVAGSFTALGSGGDTRLRVDVKLIEATRREAVTLITESAAVDDLFTLVSRVGARLRGSLHAERLTAAEAQVARLSFPAGVEAARLYSNGLARLRAFDAMGAREPLQRAVELAPDFALAHAALASCWRSLGNDREAAAAAGRALERAGGLSRRERLEVEALARETQWDRAGELAIRQTLFTFYPDSPEYGLSLAQTQVMASRAGDALETVTRLRSLPPPAGDDPRIDLAEAEALDSLGRPEEAAALAARAAANADTHGASLLAARALLAEGKALARLGRVADSDAALTNARGRYQRAGDLRGTGQALTQLGALRLVAGEPAEARAYFEEALLKHREVGDQRGEARVLGNLGVLHRRSGRFPEARTVLEASVATCSDTGDLGCEGRGLENLGNLFFQSGELTEARRHYERALGIFRRTGDRGEEAQVLGNLGALHAGHGELDEARERYEAALAVFVEAGDLRRQSMTLNNLAIVLRDSGSLPAARASWEEALALKERIRDRRGAGIVRLNLGQLLVTEGDLTGALGRCAEATSIFREIEDQTLLIEGLLALGDGLLAGGKLEESAVSASEALHLCQQIEHEPCVERARLALARLDLERGGSDGLVEAFRAAAEGFRTRQAPEWEAGARTSLVRALLAENRSREAETELKWAEAAAEASGSTLVRDEVAIAGARVDAALGRSDAALETLQGVIREAAETGCVSSNLAARLAIAEIGMLSLGDEATVAAVEDLGREAERRGFGLIARRARALLEE